MKTSLQCSVDKLPLTFKTKARLLPPYDKGKIYDVYYCPNGHKYRVINTGGAKDATLITRTDSRA